ncbi:calcium/sodium antiporter [Actibacterium sp. 188UL27-1]|uniref:calcium/sodium antiporter n=1 Tax=Actibacterium sp. 188UL27-1 TaxID=2786961 RepID=UPI00195E3E2D|nr:calcium/sodium antiporter [Actibacterium sp. 188UL27-1]MBM7069018.1 calcium/sodium antiporter [Actibacterium sp. 188UL27-1]
MILDIGLAVLGLVILLLAGDALVKGAVNLALRVGVPALLVSLTIVAFGTSAPELLISIQAVLEDVPGIAIGNVVGSNIANVLLVLGVPALMAGLDTGACETRKTYTFMISATLLFMVVAFLGPISWIHGLILLGALGFVLYDAFLTARSHRRNGRDMPEEDEVEGADPSVEGWKIALFLVLGMIGLPLGADLLVDSSMRIAKALHVSDTVIGLTLVAIGTSMPELATTVMAALRRQADVALGNVIGSNMFNLLAIIGITALVGEIPVPMGVLQFDLWVMLAASLLLLPFVFRGRNMGRTIGIVFTTLYAIYLMTVIFYEGGHG